MFATFDWYTATFAAAITLAVLSFLTTICAAAAWADSTMRWRDRHGWVYPTVTFGTMLLGAVFVFIAVGLGPSA
jgi:roadblock/LC7 domain-containing protein